MKNAFIYFFTALFLLFVVESRLSLHTLRNDYFSHSSQNLPKKANRLNQTLEKISTQHKLDNVKMSSEVEESDYSYSNSGTLIAFTVSIFLIIYLFALHFGNRVKGNPFRFIADIFSVKRFILIRSIRI
ncbi:hypothetical protein [Chryseobacterium oryzae]|uniref:Uncharacterized protein n=1 Tax=Chryseobacterium oryzae TaxID=2929799 RepID=A0ABY4BJC3_9FLAO|nr:hypothetical protein [Chryseobacterium oryzae]UOE37816.1 hypothetical protein MTP08_12275 [Chryseobacterium oryzae]